MCSICRKSSEFDLAVQLLIICSRKQNKRLPMQLSFTGYFPIPYNFLPEVSDNRDKNASLQPKSGNDTRHFMARRKHLVIRHGE